MSELDPLKEGGDSIFKMESRLVSDIFGYQVIFEFHHSVKQIVIALRERGLRKEKLLAENVQDIAQAKACIEAFKVGLGGGYKQGWDDCKAGRPIQ